MRPEPTRIEPIFSPRIWGARSLAPLFPEKSNLTEPLGEAWLTGVDCKIASGPFTGKTLGAAWREMPAEWRGTRLASTSDFPILVKFIFPTDKLSIQVHPDDAYAAAHEQAAGGRGKTEMWHALSAEPDACVLIGLVPKADKESFVKALETNSLEKLFIHWRVQPGDTFFVPAGTPHTIGPNMVICEVQEYSDLTYRVYDYGRVDSHGKPRELHIEKALEVMDFDAAATGKVSPRSWIPGRKGIEHLVDCSYFSVDRWDFDKKVHLSMIRPKPGEGRFQLVVVLAGEGMVSWPPKRRAASSFQFKQGECWFVPANTFQSYSYYPKGKVSLLTASVP